MRRMEVLQGIRQMKVEEGYARTRRRGLSRRGGGIDPAGERAGIPAPAGAVRDRADGRVRTTAARARCRRAGCRISGGT